MIGIYKIVDHKGREYIGSSKNIKRRFIKHKRDLRANQHHNVYLQRIYNKYGENSLNFEVIELLNDESELFIREQYYIDGSKNNLNIGSVGGDNITNHPNRESIKNTLIKHLDDNRHLIKPKYGEDNPNWKGGVPICSQCGIKIKRQSKTNTCRNCIDKSGENNSFYGKSHSEETKRIIQEKAKQRAIDGFLPKNTRPVIANGVVYKSVSECSRALNIGSALCIYRIKSPKWDYNYIN